MKTNHAIKMLVFKNKTEAELEQGFELKTATNFFIQRWKNVDGAAFFLPGMAPGHLRPYL